MIIKWGINQWIVLKKIIKPAYLSNPMLRSSWIGALLFHVLIWRNQTCPENYTSEGDLDFTEEDKNVLTKLLSDQLELAETSMKEKGKQASECLQHLRKIMQNCHLLTTFDFGSIGVSSTEDDAPIFDEAILQALIKSATVDPFEQLEFALKFNQIKFVRERLVHNFDQFKSSGKYDCAHIKLTEYYLI